jgi:prevent-host-death family protein
MEKSISIGQLRQNPTVMIREVRHGARYTLTDRGEPVALITPHEHTRWRSGSEVNDVLANLGADPAWAAELETARDELEIVDPWVAS